MEGSGRQCGWRDLGDNVAGGEGEGIWATMWLVVIVEGSG